MSISKKDKLIDIIDYLNSVSNLKDLKINNF